MHFGVLHELARVDLLLNLIDGTKMVMRAVLFSLPRFPRRVTHGESEFVGGEVLLEELDERAFACERLPQGSDTSHKEPTYKNVIE